MNDETNIISSNPVFRIGSGNKNGFYTLQVAASSSLGF